MLMTVYRAVVDTLLSLPTISDDCATTIDDELHTLEHLWLAHVRNHDGNRDTLATDFDDSSSFLPVDMFKPVDTLLSIEVSEKQEHAQPGDEIDITTRATTSSPQGFPSLSSIYAQHPEITDPTRRREAARRAKMLHDIHHVGPLQLEKIISCTPGTGCKPGYSRYVGSCDRCDAVLDTFKVQEARGVATRSTSRARTVGGLYHHLHKKPQPKATVQFPWR